jgi:hypothetical protein
VEDLRDVGGGKAKKKQQWLLHRRPGPLKNSQETRPLCWRALEDLNLWPSDS